MPDEFAQVSGADKEIKKSITLTMWADPMECYRYLRNIQDLLSDGKSPYERRFGVPFEDQVTLLGAMIE